MPVCFALSDDIVIWAISELAKDEKHFRSGAITPDGLIDEDYEDELGSPTQVGGS